MELKTTTSGHLLQLARKFREDARATEMPEYAQIMNRTAEELETSARDLDSGCRGGETPRVTPARNGA